MSNFMQDILEEAAGEDIESIVIGEMGWGDYNSDRVPTWEQIKAVNGQVITWEQAAPLLDYNYSTGYGAPECNSITAWTATRVLFVSQYDGSTCIESIPRNPVPHKPSMPGG